MATQKETLEKLHSKDEILYWAKKNGIEIEEFPGGIYVDDWSIILEEGRIVSVERRLDEPGEL